MMMKICTSVTSMLDGRQTGTGLKTFSFVGRRGAARPVARRRGLRKAVTGCDHSKCAAGGDEGTNHPSENLDWNRCVLLMMVMMMMADIKGARSP